jgi:hypothetical protein
MGKGRWSDQRGRGGWLTSEEGVVFCPMVKGLWSDQWGRRGRQTMGKGWWSEQWGRDGGLTMGRGGDLTNRIGVGF